VNHNARTSKLTPRARPAAAERDLLQGLALQPTTDEELRDALEKAFDYRGDVTITLRDGTRVEGYVFDRLAGPTLAASCVRIIPTRPAPTRAPGSPSPTPTSPRWPSPDAIPPPAKAGKRGSRSTLKRRPPARPASSCVRRASISAHCCHQTIGTVPIGSVPSHGRVAARAR